MLLSGCAPGSPGVVDQNIQAPVLGEHLLDERLGGVDVLQVARQGDHVHALALQVRRSLVELGLLARRDGDLRAHLAECLGDLQPSPREPPVISATRPVKSNNLRTLIVYPV